MAGYIRQDVTNNIADGNVINASDFDNEYNAIEAAFHATTGHTHDGTSAEGAPITKIGPAQDIVAGVSSLTPKTDNTVDLGSSTLEFKDLYIDGTANIDSLVADTADINAGTIDGVTIGGASAGAGSFTTLSASSTTTLSGLTASTALALNASKEVVSVTNTGTGNNVMSASPTLTGTVAGASLQLSSLTSGRVTYAGASGLLQDSTNLTFDGTSLTLGGNPTLSAGADNGVLYLNGSKVATSGSALTFDGTNLGVGSDVGVSPTNGLTRSWGNSKVFSRMAFDGSYYMEINADAANRAINYTVNSGDNTAKHIWNLGAAGTPAEQMRLTSTGLGIGNSSPTEKLDVTGNFKLSGTATLSGGTANGVLYLNGSKVATSGSALTFDGSNLGLGVTPSAWDTATFRTLQVGSGVGSVSLSGRTDNGKDLVLGSNIYYATGSFRYVGTGVATMYRQDGAEHQWFTAPSGTAGNAISFTQALTLDANRNLLLNGTTAGASSVGTFTIFNGTAPTGSVTDGVILFAQDISSSSELRVRDEAGNVTTLSPHNFSLIPEGPSEDMAWAYYSEKGGKRINVDMLKLARMVEKLTGEKLVYES